MTPDEIPTGSSNPPSIEQPAANCNLADGSSHPATVEQPTSRDHQSTVEQPTSRDHQSTVERPTSHDDSALDKPSVEDSSPDKLIKLIRRHLRLAESLKDYGDDHMALSTCREILFEINLLAAAIIRPAPATQLQNAPSAAEDEPTAVLSPSPKPHLAALHPLSPQDFIRLVSYQVRELIFYLGKSNPGARDHDNKAELRSLCMQILKDPEVSKKRRSHTFKTLINVFLSYPGAIQNEPHRLLTAELMDCIDHGTLKFTSLRLYNTGNLKAAACIKEYLLTRPNISAEGRAETLKFLSSDYEELGDFESAIKTLERLLEYLEEKKIPDDVSRSLGFQSRHHIFRLKIRLHGEDSQGSDTIAARRKLYEDLITDEGKAGNEDLLLAYHSLSFLYEEMGDLRKALAAVIKAGELMAESSGGYKNRIIQVKNRRFALATRIRAQRSDGSPQKVLLRPKNKAT